MGHGKIRATYWCACGPSKSSDGRIRSSQSPLDPRISAVAQGMWLYSGLQYIRTYKYSCRLWWFFIFFADLRLCSACHYILFYLLCMQADWLALSHPQFQSIISSLREVYLLPMLNPSNEQFKVRLHHELYQALQLLESIGNSISDFLVFVPEGGCFWLEFCNRSSDKTFSARNYFPFDYVYLILTT